MKNIVTDFNDPNEHELFNNSILGNFCLDTFFQDFTTNIYSLAKSKQQYELHPCTQIVEPNCNIVDSKNTNLDLDINLWTLYFYSSKSNEGAGVRYILNHPKGNKTLIACILDFECTNDTVEYEAII